MIPQLFCCVSTVALLFLDGCASSIFWPVATGGSSVTCHQRHLKPRTSPYYCYLRVLMRRPEFWHSPFVMKVEQTSHLWRNTTQISNTWRAEQVSLVFHALARDLNCYLWSLNEAAPADLRLFAAIHLSQCFCVCHSQDMLHAKMVSAVFVGGQRKTFLISSKLMEVVTCNSTEHGWLQCM